MSSSWSKGRRTHEREVELEKGEVSPQHPEAINGHLPPYFQPQKARISSSIDRDSSRDLLYRKKGNEKVSFCDLGYQRNEADLALSLPSFLAGFFLSSTSFSSHPLYTTSTTPRPLSNLHQKIHSRNAVSVPPPWLPPPTLPTLSSTSLPPPPPHRPPILPRSLPPSKLKPRPQPSHHLRTPLPP